MEKLFLMEWTFVGWPLILQKKSMEKLSQVLDTRTYNMQLCIYPCEE